MTVQSSRAINSQDNDPNVIPRRLQRRNNVERFLFLTMNPGIITSMAAESA